MSGSGDLFFCLLLFLFFCIIFHVFLSFTSLSSSSFFLFSLLCIYFIYFISSFYLLVTYHYVRTSVDLLSLSLSLSLSLFLSSYSLGRVSKNLVLAYQCSCWLYRMSIGVECGVCGVCGVKVMKARLQRRWSVVECGGVRWSVYLCNFGVYICDMLVCGVLWSGV